MTFLQTAFNEAYKEGIYHSADKRSSETEEPHLKKPNDNAGGATKLAAYLAHATALGYYMGGPKSPLSLLRNDPRGQPGCR